jgi:hypothetical protein
MPITCKYPLIFVMPKHKAGGYGALCSHCVGVKEWIDVSRLTCRERDCQNDCFVQTFRLYVWGYDVQFWSVAKCVPCPNKHLSRPTCKISYIPVIVAESRSVRLAVSEQQTQEMWPPWSSIKTIFVASVAFILLMPSTQTLAAQ